MKYYPTNIQHTTNYTTNSQLEGVDLHQNYCVTHGGRPTANPDAITTKIFVYEKPPYKVGDVLVGTYKEIVNIFSSRLNMNHHTRNAALKGSVENKTTLEVKPEEELIEIKDSLTITESDQKSDVDRITYKGVDILFKPVVNGVVFSNTDEAKTAIDLALRLNLN